MLGPVFSYYAFLFIVYSILGWICESFIASIKAKRFINRGFMYGPYCPVYGLAMLLIIPGAELTGKLAPLVFLISAVLATLINLLMGFIFKSIFSSGKKIFNDKKYHSRNRTRVINFLLSGFGGMVGIYLIQPQFHLVIKWFYPVSFRVLCSVILGIMILDLIFSIAFVINVHKKLEEPEDNGNRIKNAFNSMLPIVFIDEYDYINNSKNKIKSDIQSYLSNHDNHRFSNQKDSNKNESFRKKIVSGYKDVNLTGLVWVFLIGSVIGYIVETMYCILHNGFIESRQGMVYGPFSQVYGLGALIMVLCLAPIAKKKMIWLFLSSAIIGGLFEAGISFFQELLFGTTSWNYSEHTLSIFAGRTSLEYMFFWGAMGTVYMNLIYPKIVEFIKNIPGRIRTVLTITIAIILSLDLLISGIAVERWSARQNHIPPSNKAEEFIDYHYSDRFMREVYPHMHIS